MIFINFLIGGVSSLWILGKVDAWQTLSLMTARLLEDTLLFFYLAALLVGLVMVTAYCHQYCKMTYG